MNNLSENNISQEKKRMNDLKIENKIHKDSSLVYKVEQKKAIYCKVTLLLYFTILFYVHMILGNSMLTSNKMYKQRIIIKRGC